MHESPVIFVSVDSQDPIDPVVSVCWSRDGRAVRIIDQRALPQNLIVRDVTTVDEVCDAIRTLAVRGAPAIGVFAAMGLACVMQAHSTAPRTEFDQRLQEAARRIRATRPTAVNLGWAIDRQLISASATYGDAPEICAVLRQTADAIRAEDIAMCQRIGELALPLLAESARVLTHCNAGALATAGIGTALAPIYLAHRSGRRIHVYVGETRPLMQGSRLTSWELQRAGIPTTLTTDSAAAELLRTHEIDCVIVGADRIAANGDAANKIGTYGLAVLARHHGVPFYVAAPTSTIDLKASTGSDIPIEQRDGHELSAPSGVDVFNPAFDVTPATLISAIITDRAVHHPVYDFRKS